MNTKDSNNSWHKKQKCPQCGNNDLEITSEHDTGCNSYHCNKCGCSFGN